MTYTNKDYLKKIIEVQIKTRKNFNLQNEKIILRIIEENKKNDLKKSSGDIIV